MAPEFLLPTQTRTKAQIGADRVFVQALHYAKTIWINQMYMVNLLAPYALPDYLQRVTFNPFNGILISNRICWPKDRPHDQMHFPNFVYKWVDQAKRGRAQKEENQK